MRLHPTLTALLTATVLALTGCAGTEDTPASTSTVAIEPTPGLTPDDLADHTQATFDLTWSMASETEKDTYCASVALLGPDRAADEMRAGAGYDDSLDWPQMAALLDAECNLR